MASTHNNKYNVDNDFMLENFINDSPPKLN